MVIVPSELYFSDPTWAESVIKHVKTFRNSRSRSHAPTVYFPLFSPGRSKAPREGYGHFQWLGCKSAAPK